jgi:hypothetical protein
MEGELVQAILPVQSPPPIGFDMIVEALKELQRSALEVHASEHDQLLNFDFGR